MEQRTFGRTGRDASVVGLGTWQLGADWGDVSEADARAVLEASAAAGVTFYDTADVYGDGRSEQIVGRFLAGCVDYYSHIMYWGSTRPVHDLWVDGAETWRNGEYLTTMITDAAASHDALCTTLGTYGLHSGSSGYCLTTYLTCLASMYFASTCLYWSNVTLQAGHW